MKIIIPKSSGFETVCPVTIDGERKEFPVGVEIEVGEKWAAAIEDMLRSKEMESAAPYRADGDKNDKRVLEERIDELEELIENSAGYTALISTDEQTGRIVVKPPVIDDEGTLKVVYEITGDTKPALSNIDIVYASVRFELPEGICDTDELLVPYKEDFEELGLSWAELLVVIEGEKLSLGFKILGCNNLDEDTKASLIEEITSLQGTLKQVGWYFKKPIKLQIKPI